MSHQNKSFKKKKKLVLVSQPQLTIKKKKKKKLKLITINESVLNMPQPPYNQQFIDILGQLESFMVKKGEFMRARAYQKAQQAIIMHDNDIKNPNDIKHLKGIGKTILDKLQEYVSTGKVEAIEKEKKNPLHIFTDIYGIGPKKAKELIAQGITDIPQLKQNESQLNNVQRIGLNHYEDIIKRIPRKEIETYHKIFEKVFKTLKYNNASLEIVGSYRRGGATSGDIDVILTDANNNPQLLKDFVSELEKKKIITVRLTNGKSKILVITELPGKPARRVDFLYSPPSEYAFALLYFTGSKIFNTVMRQKALDLGYTLNEHGIYHMQDKTKGKKVDLKFKTEEDVFKFLNLKYKKPTERKGASAVQSFDEEASTDVNMSPENKSYTKKVNKIMLKTANKVDQAARNIEIFKKKGIVYLEQLSEDEIEDMIKHSTDVYHNDPDNVLLSDDQFDIIKDYISEKYPKNVVIKQIGTPIRQNKQKVVLPYPMPSMDKIKPTTNALGNWLKKFNKPKEYVISAKLDGVSGLYSTENDEQKLYTRGDGTIGQDISYLIPHLKLPKEKNIVIRGEFIISKTNFEKHFKQQKNARNTVAGLINKITVDQSKIKYVDFVAYEVIKPEKKSFDQLEFLSSMKTVETVKYEKVKTLSNEYLSTTLVSWREKYKYDIDGIIVSHNRIYSKRVNKNPEHAFAFKMVLSDQKAEARVVNVIWTPSKDGFIKPKIQIEPIELGGVKIEYATGFNAAFIKKNKIGIGAIVEMVRSGDVIPKVEKVIKPAPEPLMPDIPYVWNKTNVDILLVNKEDNAIVREKNIAGFFKNIGVEGMSTGTISALVKAGYNTVPAILKMKKSDYLKLDGFKDKRASNIYNNLHTTLKDVSLITLMKASNIFGRGFGERKVKPILDKYPDILTSDESSAIKIEKVMNVEGIGPTSAPKFVAAIPLFIQFLKDCGLDSKLKAKTSSEKPKDTSHPLFGKSIIMTGFRDKNLSKKITDHGGIIGSSVSKKTFVVLVPDKDEDTGKITQAKKLGLTLMLPDEFSKKYKL
jgi:DNA ligase (NAD+)